MSIKVMSWIWEHATVGGSELLVLLAMADFADDNGGSIFPSMQTLAKKARMSTDQARRVVHKLIAEGHVELVQEGGWDGARNRSNEYRLILDRTCKPQVPRTRKMQAPSADASTRTSADASTVLAPMQDDPSYNLHKEPPFTTDDEDKRKAFGAVVAAWQDNIRTPIGPMMDQALKDLVDECGAPAVIHGISVAALKGIRDVKYVTTVARNHVAGVPPKQPRQSSRPMSKVATSMAESDRLIAMLKGESK